jgi:hypothetical protein
VRYDYRKQNSLFYDALFGAVLVSFGTAMLVFIPELITWPIKGEYDIKTVGIVGGIVFGATLPINFGLAFSQSKVDLKINIQYQKENF